MAMTRRALIAGGAATHVARSWSQDAAVDPGLRGASAGLVADALRAAGVDPRAQTLATDMKRMTRPGAPVAGPAVTTKWEPARGEPMAQDAIRRFLFEPIDEAPAGAMWVVESGTDQLLSMFGDLIALGCKKRGMAGAVTDSGCRDVAAMDRAGFPVFAKGAVLYGPGAVIRPVAANVPVRCGGVAIEPGDIVVADNDGVIVVPKAHLEAVREATEVLQAKEAEVRRRIEDGEPLARAYTL